MIIKYIDFKGFTRTIDDAEDVRVWNKFVVFTCHLEDAETFLKTKDRIKVWLPRKKVLYMSEML